MRWMLVDNLSMGRTKIVYSAIGAAGIVFPHIDTPEHVPCKNRSSIVGLFLRYPWIETIEYLFSRACLSFHISYQQQCEPLQNGENSNTEPIIQLDSQIGVPLTRLVSPL